MAHEALSSDAGYRLRTTQVARRLHYKRDK